MDIEKDKVVTPLWAVVLIVLTILTLALGVWYYRVADSDVKTLGLLGGIIGGLVVFILTFFGYINLFQQLGFFRRLGVRNLLVNRHLKDYYKKYVGNAKERVDVMGSSCSRFVDDFLDVDKEDRVLVDAMAAHPGLKVRLLVPDEKHMSVDAKARLAKAKEKLIKLHKQLPDRVQVRRFAEEARHSLVIADEDLITGPIFETDRGMYDPAVHVLASTAFGKKYLKHFDDIWSKSIVDQ
jgi:hypothetical protein